MNLQKSIMVLAFTLFAVTGLMTANSKPLILSECKSFIHFNETMQAELQLTNEQFEKILALNKEYWVSRNNILDDPNIMGQNIALLVCWDKWQLKLSTLLTKAQIQQFKEWQSQVDLLSEVPY